MEILENNSTIYISKNAVFHTIPHSKITHCFPFNNILILEYKNFIINLYGTNQEVTGCVFHTANGIRTLLCNENTYNIIKEAWLQYYFL
jgi:hypothetical protein